MILYTVGEATGKGRIPYGQVNELGCIVTGLPQGIEFKQPNQYLSSELRLIINNLDTVQFLPLLSSATNMNSEERERERDLGAVAPEACIN